MASQITSLAIVYSTVYSGADQRKHQSSASLAFVRGIHQSPVNSSHKGPVTRKIFPFDDVIMKKNMYFPKYRPGSRAFQSFIKAATRDAEHDVFMGQNMAWPRSSRSYINYVNPHWSHFPNEISRVNQILQQFHFALFQIIMQFAHCTTAALSWLAQKFVGIWWRS